MAPDHVEKAKVKKKSKKEKLANAATDQAAETPRLESPAGDGKSLKKRKKSKPAAVEASEPAAASPVEEPASAEKSKAKNGKGKKQNAGNADPAGANKEPAVASSAETSAEAAESKPKKKKKQKAVVEQEPSAPSAEAEASTKKKKKKRKASEIAEAAIEAPVSIVKGKRKKAKKQKTEDKDTDVAAPVAEKIKVAAKQGKAAGIAEVQAADAVGETTVVSPAGTRGGTAAKAFQRVKAEEWLNKKGAWNNSYEAAFGSSGYGAKAQEVLGQVRGKDFRHEKTKKKRGSYRGGVIDGGVRSQKFESDDDE